MAKKKATGKLVIAILDRGWVFIGRATEIDSVTGITLTNAACIRYWGTTKGIGQLALNGPQSSTKLDEAGTLSFPHHIALIDADESQWPGR
jgi:hypothetical protein